LLDEEGASGPQVSFASTVYGSSQICFTAGFDAVYENKECTDDDRCCFPCPKNWSQEVMGDDFVAANIGFYDAIVGLDGQTSVSTCDDGNPYSVVSLLTDQQEARSATVVFKDTHTFDVDLLIYGNKTSSRYFFFSLWNEPPGCPSPPPPPPPQPPPPPPPSVGAGGAVGAGVAAVGRHSGGARSTS